MDPIQDFRAYLEQGDLDSARRIIKEGEPWESKTHLRHYMQALLCNEEADLEGMEAELERCLKLEPTFAPALNAQGLAFTKRGRLAETIASFEAALRADPNYFDARLNLAIMCVVQKKPDEAALHLEQASQLCGDSAKRHDSLAHLFGEMKHFDQAKTHWLEASRLSPDWDEPLRNAGLACEKMRNWSEAETIYRQLVTKSPRNPEYRRRLRTSMACADMTRFHLTRWTRTAVQVADKIPTEKVLYDGHEVPVIVAKNADQFAETIASLKALSEPQTPILLRGQRRNWMANGEVSLKPAGLRTPRATDEVLADVEQWREALRPFLSELTDPGPGVFGWGDFESGGNFFNPPGIALTGNMLEMSWQPELVGTMQHYGFPTEFLDVTPNENVALWFALRRADLNEDGAFQHSPTQWTESDSPDEWPTIYVFAPERTQVVDLTDGCLSEEASPRAIRQHAVLLSFSIYYEPALDQLAQIVGIDHGPQVISRAPQLVLMIRLHPDESWTKLPLPEADWYFPPADEVYQQLNGQSVRHLAHYAHGS